ncbi:helix-turn-helix domain-containing protein [Glycomyces sp. L485]|uniref:ArsR/SmtB family transcription factor n=1 Tax=Glycomyces sp. L485 TaxID=2909235 RepID=UPI001F4BB391|nr:metalloregulator ArsR/SmtB family transcription factor [Glycomyces sp. L485]MCH7229276.1 helix-turn-helix domain-containing protein [Glycomyces sp. L485]
MPETSASNADPDLPDPPKPPARPVEVTDPERVRITDPERMKALAHPARIAVFDYLAARRVQGYDGATATEMAEVAGMTPSAMSYHLRTLAKAGFIEEAPSRGDARERLWRLALHSFSIQAEEGAPEGDRAAERAMAHAFAEQDERGFRRWIESKGEMDPEVRDASGMSQGRLRLTTAEAKEFQTRFHKLQMEYAELTRKRVEADSDGDDSMVFTYLFRLFPYT